ncbi:unnamed protein product [Auanema sp. JU1783]|nr:unnamed protein product [Auanema sp. JU1783]
MAQMMRLLLISTMLISLICSYEDVTDYAYNQFNTQRSCWRLPYMTTVLDKRCIITSKTKCNLLPTIFGQQPIEYDDVLSEIFELRKQGSLEFGVSYEAKNNFYTLRSQPNPTAGYLCQVDLPNSNCPNSNWVYFGSSCYLPVNERLSAGEAQEYCAVRDAYLPLIMSDRENRFLAQLANEKFTNYDVPGRPIWLPLLYAPFNAQNWRNIMTQYSIRYLRWKNNLLGNEIQSTNVNETIPAVLMYTDKFPPRTNQLVFGYWGIRPRNAQFRFICQKSLNYKP